MPDRSHSELGAPASPLGTPQSGDYVGPRPGPEQRPRYAPLCRQATHPTIVHHEATERRYSCDCPCHDGNEAGPWWADWAAEQVRTAGERRATRLRGRPMAADRDEIGTPGYERIEGWRITEHELGPHEQTESCDESPVCQHVYRCAPGRQEVAL